jgi:hypothetical protein
MIPSDGERVSFVPDVIGDYQIELSVFDGELWSDPSLQLAEARATIH